MNRKSDWLSITEFASRLCLSRHTVEGLVKTGGLKVFNISPGKERPTYRLPESELDAALALMQTTIGDQGGDADVEAAVRDAV
jgi:excisionase family DNA binding protein